MTPSPAWGAAGLAVVPQPQRQGGPAVWYVRGPAGDLGSYCPRTGYCRAGAWWGEVAGEADALARFLRALAGAVPPAVPPAAADKRRYAWEKADRRDRADRLRAPPGY